MLKKLNIKAKEVHAKDLKDYEDLPKFNLPKKKIKWK